MRRPSAVLAALGLTALTLTGPAPSQAVTGNATVDDEHPYVALLVFYTEPAEPGGDPYSHRCTGSLLADRVTVVTAGHCTQGVDTGRAYFQTSPFPDYDPTAFGGRGGDTTTGYPYLGGTEFRDAANLGFGSRSLPDTGDLGVVVLDEPVTLERYAELPAPGAVDTYTSSSSAKRTVDFTLSGYGVSQVKPRVLVGQRLTARSQLVSDDSPVSEYHLKTSSNASQGKGGSCVGDSGGPVLAEGTDVLLAVVSFGRNDNCRGVEYSYRVDREETLAWIGDDGRVDAG
ncbi:trypsin-like serine protease [Nocardioides sp. HDW12B]|uniref:trypsin-like serine protease n=1 Tax=Nocardioides sp. HDW12B TaxID=2714939 RepID=UPI00140870EC|nr:trypsin-like serine protease [Nocardioides sp. HDW12B]QIK66390.1 trypsin-like serine protease [Nocardioides sp. HDW12B]